LWLSADAAALSQGSSIRGGGINLGPRRQQQQQQQQQRGLPKQQENLVVVLEVLDLRFSLWHPAGWRAVDYHVHKNNEESGEFFTNDVLDVLDDFLCQEADLIVMTTNGDEDDSSNSNRTTLCRNWNVSTGSSSSRLRHENSTVVDASEAEVEWTEWIITYAILHVSQKVSDLAEVMMGDEDEDDETPVSKELVMQQVTQLALDVTILEGAMDSLLLEGGVRWSSTDQEVATFQPFVVQQRRTGDDTNNNNGDDRDYEAPDHRLRITGIVLLVVDTCITLYLRRLGRLRLEQRESETAKKQKELGGLITEEGLDRILDIGKLESMVLYDESRREQLKAARQGGVAGGGSSSTRTTLVLQDEACVLPEDYKYNLHDRIRPTLISNPSDAGQSEIELDFYLGEDFESDSDW
jgi:hypothetical protein